jgi:hypothetical protein
MAIGRQARGYEEADEYHDIDCLVEACILPITQCSADWQVLQNTCDSLVEAVIQ